MAIKKLNISNNNSGMRIGAEYVVIDYGSGKQHEIYDQVRLGTEQLSKKIKIAEEREKNSWSIAKSRQVVGKTR